MYNTSYFKEKNPEKVLDFIHKQPFALITTSDENGYPVATQIPVLLEERGDKKYLIGHVMRNSDHHKAFAKCSNVLAVFTGPHCYVSASWYSNPHTGSTWNYISVHVRGPLRFLEHQEKIEVMKRLSLHFERGDTKSPTFYDNLDHNYTSKMMPAIDAFEIEIDSIENIFKLSQNRDEASYRNIIKKLKERGDSQYIVEAMEERLGELF